MDLGERCLPTGRGIVAKGCKSTVIGRTELFERNIASCFQDAISHLLRGFYSRVNGRYDAYEYSLVRPESIADHPEHIVAIGFGRQRHVEIGHVQGEQARQQL